MSPPGNTRFSGSPWWTLLTVIVGTGMPFADTTITNIGRFYIVSGLGITPYETGWLTAGYSLALAMGIPLSHRLRGFMKEKDLYSLALLAFMAGSLMVAMASRFSQAMVGRGLEGLAGGILIPLAPALIQEVFPEKRIAAAQSLFAISSSIWVTLGPTIGGLIIDDIGWRMAFGINIPTGCLAMVMAQFFLRNHPLQDRRPFDLPGFLLLSAALGIFFTATMSAEWYGWHSARIAHGEMAASFFFCLFLLWSARTQYPILPPEVLARPLFALLLLVDFLQATQSFGRLYLLAPFLERNDRFQAHHAGAIVAVGAITEIIVSLSFFLNFLGRRRWVALLAAGCFFVGIANIDFLFLPDNVFDMSFTVISQLVFGAGLALSQMAFPQLIREIQTPDLLRAATTYFLFFQFLGGAWGTMISRYFVHHIQPVFLLSFSQLSRPPEDPGTLLKIRHLAAEYTSNMIFFDLGLAGLLGAALTLLFFLFFRPATDPPDPSVSGV